MKAFIITMPGLKDDLALEMGLMTMAATPEMAWRRHIGPPANYDRFEYSRRVQAWHDMGYRVREVEVNMERPNVKNS